MMAAAARGVLHGPKQLHAVPGRLSSSARHSFCTSARGRSSVVARGQSTSQLRIFEPQDIALLEHQGTATVLDAASAAAAAAPHISWTTSLLSEESSEELPEQQAPLAAPTSHGLAAPAPGAAAAGSSGDVQDGEGAVRVQLYRGEVLRGQLAGTPVLLKAYPHHRFPNADALAANELTMHASLQPPVLPAASPHMARLLGGFVSRQGASAGQQWLVFQDPSPGGASLTAAAYAERAAAATAAGKQLGGESSSTGVSWSTQLPLSAASSQLEQRKAFLREVLRQAFQGLAFMHDNNRLHQAMGPAALLLSTSDERSVSAAANNTAAAAATAPAPLRVQLLDLACGVDVSDEALYGGATLDEIWNRGQIRAARNPLLELSKGLWRRARAAGAWSEQERRQFGFADDMAMAGWLLAHLVFVPLSAPGSADGRSLQRLFQGAFALDWVAIREYAGADERWAHATAWLEEGGGAGWALLEALLQTNWEARPNAAEVLEHPFLRK